MAPERRVQLESDPHVIGRYGRALGLSGRARGPLPRKPVAPTLAFFLVMTYVVLEYARPQDSIPLLTALRPSLIVSALLAFTVAKFAKQVSWFRPQVLLFALLLVFMGAWVPFATNNFWALKTTLVLMQTFLFCAAFATFVDTEQRLRTFMLVWLAAGLYQALFGVLHGGTGTGYFQGDENDFALTMCMILPFAVMSAGAMPKRWTRLLCWATAFMCLVGIVSSDSRGGFVGLLTTSAAMLVIHRQRARLVLAGVVAAGALAYMAPATYWDEMRTILQEGGTRADRVELWGIAWDVYRDNPVVGVGPSNVNWVINEYQDWEPAGKLHGGRAVHSLYLTLLAELGTLGAVLMLAMLCFNGRDLLHVMRAPRDRISPAVDAFARATACSIAAYLVCGVFLSVLWYPHFFVLTAVTLSTLAVHEREAPLPGDFEAEGTEEPEGALEGVPS